jgi:hypothetical protein
VLSRCPKPVPLSLEAPIRFASRGTGCGSSQTPLPGWSRVITTPKVQGRWWTENYGADDAGLEV